MGLGTPIGTSTKIVAAGTDPHSTVIHGTVTPVGTQPITTAGAPQLNEGQGTSVATTTTYINGNVTSSTSSVPTATTSSATPGVGNSMGGAIADLEEYWWVLVLVVVFLIVLVVVFA